MTNQDERPVTEWPTLVMIAATYSVWAVSTTIVAGFWLPLAILITAFAIAQFSSLQHECLHGHPFRNKYVMVFFYINLGRQYVSSRCISFIPISETIDISSLMNLNSIILHISAHL